MIPFRTSCCFGLGVIRLSQVSQSSRCCKRSVGGKACGNIKPWAIASRDECDDYCVACQSIQLVTTESEPADIAAMVQRGPLFKKELQTALIRE